MVLFVYADRDERMRLVRNFDRDETWQDRTGQAEQGGKGLFSVFFLVLINGRLNEASESQ
jgi:hypothetical protein